MRKRTTIHIPLPENIDSRYKTLYEKKSSYICPELFVKEYSNVFVSHEGLCLQHFRLLPYSSFNICTRYDRSFGWQYYTLVLEQYMVSTFGKSLQKITLDNDKTYAIIHTKWFNYSFWIMSSLVRLQMLVDSGKPFVLLYPEEWDTIPYVQQTLQAFPSIEMQRIPAGVHIQVPHLLLPEVRPFTACLDGNVLQNLACKLRSRFDNPITVYPDKIFVNRRKAKYRKLENEDEVATCLKRRGFVEVDFDDMTIAQQIASVQHAKYIVMMHGAGMANCMFAQPNTKILELMHEYTTPETYRFVYWILANRMQCLYYVQFCKTIDDAKLEWHKNIRVNINLLTENIDKMLS